MNETSIKNLRAIADHVERFELTSLSHAHSLDQGAVDLQLWQEKGERIPVFLAWADTLGGPDVEVTAVIHGDKWHLNATGILVDGTPARLSVVIAGDERDGLDEELGNATKSVPVHRDVLAKLADPELLDDREEVSF